MGMRERDTEKQGSGNRDQDAVRLNLYRSWILKLGFAAVFIVVGMLLSFGIFMTWLGLYPDVGDPKNIYYVLWTHGLNENVNLDNAVGAMTHDVKSERLVKGLSKEQLKNRFGYIRTLNEVGPYYRLCYSQGHSTDERGDPTGGKEAVFLRDSNYMVILDNGAAVDLVLCKGY
jgi:hypothetical protein